jgi:hypothetical protein
MCVLLVALLIFTGVNVIQSGCAIDVVLGLFTPNFFS